MRDIVNEGERHREGETERKRETARVREQSCDSWTEGEICFSYPAVFAFLFDSARLNVGGVTSVPLVD